MQDLVIGNGLIVTLGETNRLIPNGALAIREGRIEAVGRTTDFVGKYAGARFLDARGRLIMPGFINTHMHFYSSFARGMPLEGFAPSNFLQILEGLWWRLDKALNLDDVRYSALVALLDCIRQGTTTVVDHHASPNAVAGSLDAIAEATTQAGIRSCLCYEVSDRDGKNVARQGVEENERFLKRCSETPDHHMLAGAFGLHASFTVDDDTMLKAAAVCGKLEAPVHVHVAEGTVDVNESRDKYGMRPIGRLDRYALLSRTALLAHCIHLNDEERALLGTRPVFAMHNPQSNMNNAVGTAPVEKMLAANVAVTLGTDGMTSDMLQELRAFGLVHKTASGDPKALGFDQMYQVALQNNARLAQELFKLKLGTIQEGAAGDVIIVDYNPPTPMAAENFMGHLFFGIVNAPVATTIVDGRILMEEGRLAALDAVEIDARARELAQRMWKRVE